MLLTAEHLYKNYGDKPLLNDVTLYLNAGDKIGLIGVNGAGKSTLLRLLAGKADADDGAISTDPNVQISYLEQLPAMNENVTAVDQVFLGHPKEFRAIHEYEARAMLNRLGIVEPDALVGTLSGGQRKRVALASVFVHPADVLILDEPTNHLDADTVLWLEERLRKFTGGLIMITHDRYFLENVANRICELDHGKLYGYEANWSKYLLLKQERLEMAQASERKRQALLRRETEWIQRGARARSTKSTERIARYQALKAQEAPPEAQKVAIAAGAARLGRKTIELDHVRKTLGGREIIDDFSYTVLRDDRVGIIGPNGAGKSTLLKLIARELQPDEGVIDVGATVRIGFFSQDVQALPAQQRPYDYICEIAPSLNTSEGRQSATQMLERFLFPSELQFSTIGKLSGGERRRLYLLGILMSAPNILLLDEPTNDLDVETLTVLEDYLADFPGAVLAVSHDRYFLDKVAASIFELPGDGRVLRSMGGYTDWLAQRAQAERAAKPKPESAAQARRGTHEAKLKFTFQEQREYQTIDQEIARLEAQIEALDVEIGENATDYQKLQNLTLERERAERELEEKTERWVYLNDLAEKIAQQNRR
ncbi:MAG: ABC-F family ATP-binding cassette domain-containing protein [Clostridia bacterium]|nr:ABC-F family ATP-binding cassette domain-containing protein [Clostridia bacterium]